MKRAAKIIYKKIKDYVTIRAIEEEEFLKIENELHKIIKTNPERSVLKKAKLKLKPFSKNKKLKNRRKKCIKQLKEEIQLEKLKRIIIGVQEENRKRNNKESVKNNLVELDTSIVHDKHEERPYYISNDITILDAPHGYNFENVKLTHPAYFKNEDVKILKWGEIEAEEELEYFSKENVEKIHAFLDKKYEEEENGIDYDKYYFATGQYEKIKNFQKKHDSLRKNYVSPDVYKKRWEEEERTKRQKFIDDKHKKEREDWFFRSERENEESSSFYSESYLKDQKSLGQDDSKTVYINNDKGLYVDGKEIKITKNLIGKRPWDNPDNWVESYDDFEKGKYIFPCAPYTKKDITFLEKPAFSAEEKYYKRLSDAFDIIDEEKRNKLKKETKLDNMENIKNKKDIEKYKTEEKRNFEVDEIKHAETKSGIFKSKLNDNKIIEDNGKLNVENPQVRDYLVFTTKEKNGEGVIKKNQFSDKISTNELIDNETQVDKTFTKVEEVNTLQDFNSINNKELLTDAGVMDGNKNFMSSQLNGQNIINNATVFKVDTNGNDKETVLEVHRKIDGFVEGEEKNFVKKNDKIPYFENAVTGQGNKVEDNDIRKSKSGIDKKPPVTRMTYDFSVGVDENGNIVHDEMDKKVVTTGAWVPSEPFEKNIEVQENDKLNNDQMLEQNKSVDSLTIEELKNTKKTDYSEFIDPLLISLLKKTENGNKKKKDLEQKNNNGSLFNRTMDQRSDQGFITNYKQSDTFNVPNKTFPDTTFFSQNTDHGLNFIGHKENTFLNSGSKQCNTFNSQFYDKQMPLKSNTNANNLFFNKNSPFFQNLANQNETAKSLISDNKLCDVGKGNLNETSSIFNHSHNNNHLDGSNNRYVFPNTSKMDNTNNSPFNNIVNTKTSGTNPSLFVNSMTGQESATNVNPFNRSLNDQNFTNSNVVSPFFNTDRNLNGNMNTSSNDFKYSGPFNDNLFKGPSKLENPFGNNSFLKSNPFSSLNLQNNNLNISNDFTQMQNNTNNSIKQSTLGYTPPGFNNSFQSNNFNPFENNKLQHSGSGIFEKNTEIEQGKQNMSNNMNGWMASKIKFDSDALLKKNQNLGNTNNNKFPNNDWYNAKRKY